ncbi:MAG TPA: helix-turn-helix domain-containing protein [Acidimicrobiales bacterium]
MATRPRPTRPPDRAATEAALEQAALRLLERNGVLAGLNLREVADEAGVNRGLVYHYFGSRRDLLRAALGADVRERIRDLELGASLPFHDRYLRMVRMMLRHRKAVVLAALLVLDGDSGVRMDPGQEGRRARLRKDVEAGHLPPDTDIDALWAALSSLVYGYDVFRTRFAEELGVDLDELDERFLAVADRIIAGVQRQDGRERQDGEAPTPEP